MTALLVGWRSWRRERETLFWKQRDVWLLHNREHRQYLSSMCYTTTLIASLVEEVLAAQSVPASKHLSCGVGAMT